MILDLVSPWVADPYIGYLLEVSPHYFICIFPLESKGLISEPSSMEKIYENFVTQMYCSQI